jgi:hypothetical protein
MLQSLQQMLKEKNVEIYSDMVKKRTGNNRFSYFQKRMLTLKGLLGK